jgi:hypothetical protein
MSEYSDAIYRLPTDDVKPSVQKQPVPRERDVDIGPPEVTVEPEEVFNKEQVEMIRNEAYESGLKEGELKARKDLSEAQRKATVGVEQDIKDQLSLLKSLSDGISRFEKKCNDEIEGTLLDILLSVIFQILEDTAKNKSLISQLLKNNLGEYKNRSEITIECNPQVASEITEHMSNAGFNDVTVQESAEMEYFHIRVNSDASIKEFDVGSYLKSYLENISSIYSEANE